MLKVNAETYSNDFSISLTYDIQPTYSVKIPKTLDVSNNQTQFTYYVCGDIYADQTLQVQFAKQTTIYYDSQTCNLNISQEKTVFLPNELSKNYASYQATISHEKLSPGSWYGELSLVISLIGGL